MNEAALLHEVEEARAGNETALAAIIARQMPLIQRLARRAARPGLDYEDAVQEGLISLFSAIESYQRGREASFPTYAAVCVRNGILSAQRAAGRKKHAPLNQSVPLSEEQSIPGPEEEAIANEAMRLTMAKVQRRLSPLERSVLRLRLEGRSYAEMARILKRPEKSVENALVRARGKLK